MSLQLRRVSADDILELRARVLRPGRPLDRARYAEDDHPPTFHVGGFLQGTLVGCATLMLQPAPMRPDQQAWRLRGMAVEPSHTRQGVGRGVLSYCMEQALQLRPQLELLWFNARHGARAFYQSMGFEPWGPDFELPEIGPHTVMWGKLKG